MCRVLLLVKAIYRQLRRTAVRGRKRTLGLVSISQVPARLPGTVPHPTCSSQDVRTMVSNSHLDR